MGLTALHKVQKRSKIFLEGVGRFFVPACVDIVSSGAVNSLKQSL